MTYLMGLLLFLIPLLAGRVILSCFYGKIKDYGFERTDALITGCMVCIGLAETAHLAGLFLGWSFSACAGFFGAAAGITGLLGGAVLLWDTFSHSPLKKRRFRQNKETSLVCQILTALAVILILLQVISIFMETEIYVAGDITLETVNSFLTTDKIYRVNPLTGAELQADMPLRIKILGLPALYGSLCRLFRQDARQVLWHIMPAFVLVCGYLVYFQLGGILFPKSKERQTCFLIMVILLMWAGDYLYGMDGFNILHGGFRGTALRSMVLIPYTFSLMLRKKKRLVVLCIAAELCVVWTLYGMGICLLVAVGMWMTDFGMRRFAERKNRTAGLEVVQK
ncbi:MAG: DUF6077 domain-containing protein [Bacteroidales bacterium]|nr:DUF6077 domain-containing protein [Lachnoclostridium sp.]MCM1383125.1 DUF6077 domain-containing protein [Lachnoclostridium sp.]MCM1465383.1 DUF6077 domain-containing protein [Bacteroidales bacterium]